MPWPGLVLPENSKPGEEIKKRKINNRRREALAEPSDLRETKKVV
ncbi:MAG TPA: hypothetical protein VH186_14000 [Chloroflexia bacterium]|nr:hypothetical protein [Chloroflexia bacterium]